MLSVDELHALLDATARGPVRAKASGQDRAVLYRVAVETGLRAGELRSVRVVNFRLDGEAPEVTVAAAYSKNRRESRLPLRPETAALLKEYLKEKAPTDVAFAVPPKEHVAKMVKADLEDARRRWLKKAKDEAKELQKREQSDFLSYRDHHGRVADFHALRHTFITNLARGGVHPKVAQALARQRRDEAIDEITRRRTGQGLAGAADAPRAQDYAGTDGAAQACPAHAEAEDGSSRQRRKCLGALLGATREPGSGFGRLGETS